jgi:hypothetical protein
MSGFARKMARQQLKAGKGLMNRTTREHEDVLQNIEAVLVASWRENSGVDDRSCHAAIESVLAGVPVKDSASFILEDALTNIRQVRADVPDSVWNDALRVVAQSIRRHSTRQPGETRYLSFVAPFVP